LAFASFISPLCALGYGALLLNEVITWHFFASFFIVIVGLTIFYLDDIKQGKLTAA
jgi:drug/metabolite transporter (DMT)-like permease